MRPLLNSVHYATEGLWHAITTERNLKVFSVGVFGSLALATVVGLEPIDWVIVLLAGGTFLSVELINTSLERISSAFYRHIEEAKDTHKHRPAMKATKDVAAAASLVLAMAWAAIMVIVFWPYCFQWAVRLGLIR